MIPEDRHLYTHVGDILHNLTIHIYDVTYLDTVFLRDFEPVHCVAIPENVAGIWLDACTALDKLLLVLHGGSFGPSQEETRKRTATKEATELDEDRGACKAQRIA